MYLMYRRIKTTIKAMAPITRYNSSAVELGSSDFTSSPCVNFHDSLGKRVKIRPYANKMNSMISPRGTVILKTIILTSYDSTSSAGAVATWVMKSMVPRNSKALSCLRYEIASATAASTASRLLRKVPSCISVSIAPISTSRLVAMVAQYTVRDGRQEVGWSLLRRFLRRMLRHAFGNLPPMSSNPPKVSRFSHSLPHRLPPDR